MAKKKEKKPERELAEWEKKRNANLKPWKKGQCGNPKAKGVGRPSGKSILKYIEEYKDTEISRTTRGESITAARALAQLVWARALDPKRKDSVKYINMILDRLYGRSKQQIEHKGELRTVADLIVRAHEYDNTESKRLMEGSSGELYP